MMAKMSLSLSPCKAKASPGLGLQSKDWKKRLTLGPSVPTGLTQDRGPDSVFRKGLSTMYTGVWKTLYFD